MTKTIMLVDFGQNQAIEVLSAIYALAIVLFVAGKEFLIDPGTYSYHATDTWRDYFRGTAAHNTVRVDGLNQSTIGGNFMWIRKANAVCEDWKLGDHAEHFVGKHDGYARLSDSLIHWRTIDFFKKAKRIEIKDTLECAGRHLVERIWHFSEKCEVTLNEYEVLASNGSTSIRMRLTDKDSDVQLQRGVVSPPAGWVSRHFGVKTPATTFLARSQIEGTSTLVTEITCDA